MTLWLARHAQPRIAPGICYGQLDVAADAEATRATALQLAEALPRPLQVISSPLQRCEQLALALIGLEPDLTYKTDFRLQEMHFGQWENQAWASLPETELAAWTDGFGSYRAGTTGETVTEFMARVAAALDELDTHTDTLWITHAGVIRAARLIAGGTRVITRADQWPADAPAYGQWCKLEVGPGR